MKEKELLKLAEENGWIYISAYQKLSEKFIEKHKERVNWYNISAYQKLSLEFIEKHKERVDWIYISAYQKLSLEFIEKHKDRVIWNCISTYQKLSLEFIEKHKDRVIWNCISEYQKLSLEFIKKHKDKINKKIQLKSNHDKRSYQDKLKEVSIYAKKYKLKYDSEYLYAYRNHDQFGRGSWNNTITYEKGKYYRDWHCDLDQSNQASFGLGIWPEGNTKVKIKIQDWGTKVSGDSKGRVWAFHVL